MKICFCAREEPDSIPDEDPPESGELLFGVTLLTHLRSGRHPFFVEGGLLLALDVHQFEGRAALAEGSALHELLFGVGIFLEAGLPLDRPSGRITATTHGPAARPGRQNRLWECVRDRGGKRGRPTLNGRNGTDAVTGRQLVLTHTGEHSHIYLITF